MQQQPNILLFITDQQRSDTMACYGNDWIQAPNMNALASESFVFENPYCAQPVCTPSRATLVTGLYPHSARMGQKQHPARSRNQIHRRNDIRHLPQSLLRQMAPGQRNNATTRI